jgi:hypothetical protein
VTRLLIHVEGETEETFVSEALSPHLCSKGYHSVSARLVGNARQRSRRGGIKGWDSVRSDIVNHLRQDAGCVATTMVDYALPQTNVRAWPGRAAASSQPYTQKATTVESALLADVVATMGNRFNPNRFVPFVMMHEFEGLLFSDCSAFAVGIGRPELANAFQAIRDDFDTPEEINDSPLTAPSKRVQELVQNYEKPLMGALAVLEIGLSAIRDECPHFAEWLDRLEANLE